MGYEAEHLSCHPFERKFYLKMTDADKVMKVLKSRVDVYPNVTGNGVFCT